MAQKKVVILYSYFYTLMKKKLLLLLVLFLLMILVSGLFYYIKYQPNKTYTPFFNRPNESIVRVQKNNQKFQKHIDSLKQFISQYSNYNNKIVFLIDMKIMSGKNRFYIFDLLNNKVLEKGLVAHGFGSETDNEDQLMFSNIPNSNATSLGKYSIDYSYIGQFGKAFKLIGLDKTNNKAFERNIVLHHFESVPFYEQNISICNSLGCPMVNKLFFNTLEKYIDQSDKSILLKIYY